MAKLKLVQDLEKYQKARELADEEFINDPEMKNAFEAEEAQCKLKLRFCDICIPKSRRKN